MPPFPVVKWSWEHSERNPQQVRYVIGNAGTAGFCGFYILADNGAAAKNGEPDLSKSVFGTGANLNTGQSTKPIISAVRNVPTAQITLAEYYVDVDVDLTSPSMKQNQALQRLSSGELQRVFTGYQVFDVPLAHQGAEASQATPLLDEGVDGLPTVPDSPVEKIEDNPLDINPDGLNTNLPEPLPTDGEARSGEEWQFEIAVENPILIPSIVEWSIKQALKVAGWDLISINEGGKGYILDLIKR